MEWNMSSRLALHRSLLRRSLVIADPQEISVTYAALWFRRA